MLQIFFEMEKRMIHDEIAMNNGVIFQRAYDILSEKMQEGFVNKAIGNSGTNNTANLDAALFVPAVVNCSFACELFLKAMLPQNTRGHKLNDLFVSLDANIQESIKNKTIEKMKNYAQTYCSADFQKDLTNNSNIFAEWRYFHEGNTNTVNYQFITNLMKATFDVVLEERNK